MLDRAELIERYRVVDRSNPLLRANFIASIDGAASRDGVSGGLNNADDKLVFDTLRMLADAIVVGAGTVRAEGYGSIALGAEAMAWRTAHGLAPNPTLVVVSSRLDLTPRHPFFTQAVRPVVVTAASAPLERRSALAAVSDVLVCGEEAVDVRLMLDRLNGRGFMHVLCEGGPQLFGALVEADCVDELCLTIAPVLEAGSAGRIARSVAHSTRAMALGHVMAAGDMLFLRYLHSRG